MSSTNFSCGGTLQINSTQADSKLRGTTGPPTVSPVIIRWDDGAQGRRIQFPLNKDTNREGAGAFEKLLAGCQPATFGLEGKDILNESYRKAVKLDNTQFCTTFDPHSAGILDAISQIMVSGVARSGLNGANDAKSNWGVIAELYKLNAYSAPSGKFKSHVDTPRGPAHFGSLVVCLPSAHQGGQLRVAHKNQELLYDFSNVDLSDIQWVAFYSDCEHEGMEVVNGHRVTLTYNLYVSEQVGGIMQKFPNASPFMYSKYQELKSLLQGPAFMVEGGSLGFYCEHRYAHTNKHFIRRLPYALKGNDAVIFSILLRGFGFKVFLRPVLEELDEYEDSDEKEVGDLIASAIHPLELSSEGGCDGDGLESEIMARIWSHEVWPRVEWLNCRSSHDVAAVHLAYGNEASLEYHYSSLAILAEIPPLSERFPA
ncbi:hypothetical protein MMC14_005111 [Varicellaria rhodocarpa]|nr:hypothetical protein [Varicellaria rhodocarpa]